MNNKNNNSEYSAQIQGFHSVKDFEEVLTSRKNGSEFVLFGLQQHVFDSDVKISSKNQNNYANGNDVVPLCCENKNMVYLSENFQVQLDSISMSAAAAASTSNQAYIPSLRCSPGLARRVVLNSVDSATSATEDLPNENEICNSHGDTYVGMRLAYSSSTDSLATSFKDLCEISPNKPYLCAPPRVSHFNDDTLIDIPLSAGSSSPSHSISCSSPQLLNNFPVLGVGLSNQQVLQLSEFPDVSMTDNKFNKNENPIFPLEERDSRISSETYSPINCMQIRSFDNTCDSKLYGSGINVPVSHVISQSLDHASVSDFGLQLKQQVPSKLQFSDPLWIKQDSPVYRGEALNTTRLASTEKQFINDPRVSTQLCLQTSSDRENCHPRQSQLQQCTEEHFNEKMDNKYRQEIAAPVRRDANSCSNNGNIRFWPSSHTYSSSAQPEADFGSDEDTDHLLQKEYDSAATERNASTAPDHHQQKSDLDIPQHIKRECEQLQERRRKGREVAVRHPDHPTVLIEGVLFRASYLGSTQLMSEGQPSKATRMMQAQEAVGRIKAPEDEHQPSVAVDLFISTEKIMVLNTNLQEIMMDHALKTISYIADIGDILVIMARRRFLSFSSADKSPPDLPHGGGNGSASRRQTKIVCHVFESDEASLIAQSIGHAFQVAYMEFLRANGIEDPGLQLKDMDYQDVLNQQEIHSQELTLFSDKQMQKAVIVPKSRHEPLGVVIVESGWGSMIPTVVLANMNPIGPAARCGQLNIGDQIISVNDVSCVGLPLVQCQNLLKSCRSRSAVKLTIVSCPPVVEVLIKRPDVKYQLGFSVQNGVICSLLRGGIAERGGVRVGHRIIEINGQSVVAVPHERVVNMLATGIGEIHMKTMPTSIFRLLTGQEVPHYI